MKYSFMVVVSASVIAYLLASVARADSNDNFDHYLWEVVDSNNKSNQELSVSHDTEFFSQMPTQNSFIALGATIATGAKVLGWISTASSIVKRVVGFFSPSPSPQRNRELDKLNSEILNLRNDLREIGQNILKEIDKNRQLIQLFELNRIVSLSESALHSLQTARLTESQNLIDAALRDSDLAVTELLNAQIFADPTIAIGPFLFAVTIRMQVVAELAPDLFIEISFRDQIDSWVRTVRHTADAFEAGIRDKNYNLAYETESFIEYPEQKKCHYAIDIRRVECDTPFSRFINVGYTNISRTVSIRRVIEESSDEVALKIARREVENAIVPGIRADLDQLGVNHMRQIALNWESTKRISLVVEFFRVILDRGLTYSEYEELNKVLKNQEPIPHQIIYGLLQTQEFRDQFVHETNKDIVQETFQRVLERKPTSEELEIYLKLINASGYVAFAAAVSSLVDLPTEQRPSNSNSDAPERQFTPTALNVIRNM